MILAKKKKKIRSNNFKKEENVTPDQMAKHELLTSLIVLFVMSFQRHGSRSFTKFFQGYTLFYRIIFKVSQKLTNDTTKEKTKRYSLKVHVF